MLSHEVEIEGGTWLPALMIYDETVVWSGSLRLSFIKNQGSVMSQNTIYYTAINV